jgi:uncharacterized caspase-like protein
MPNLLNRLILLAPAILFLFATSARCQEATPGQERQNEPQVQVPATYGKSRGSIKPENREAVIRHIRAAKAFDSQNRLSDAMLEYLAVLNLEPYASSIWLEVGLLLERQGKIEDALKAVENVTCMDPENAHAQRKFESLKAMLQNPQLRGQSSTDKAATHAPYQTTTPSPEVAKPTQSVSSAVPPPSTPAAAATQSPPDRPIKDKWALVIGISNFKNKEYNLSYAAKDAKDFYNYLINDAHFRPDHVLLLLDENATKQNIISAFGSRFLPAVAEPDDLVVVFVSTHGTPKTEDQGGRNYIVAHDTDIKDLYATGVDMDEVLHRVKEAVKSDRALIVMDACYSGGGVPGAKGMSYRANFDAHQIAQGFGHLVMSSSSPNERSWESRTTPNGVFTKYLLEALRQDNGNVDIKRAFSVANEKIGWEVKNAYQATQTPQLGGDWKGKQLILSAPPSSPREIFNPDLLELIKRCTPKADPVNHHRHTK